MFDIPHYASFIAAVLLFQVSPGPGTLMVLTASARHGVAGGVSAMAGILLGDFTHMLGAALGLAAVLHAYPLAFGALQWFGAAYLCWAGIQLLRSPVSDSGRAPGEPPRGRYFAQAYAVAVTNPMVILFFVAFFPLFLRADASPATLAVLMAHVTLLSILYQAALVFAGNAVARRLSAFPRARLAAARLAGAALVGFGIQLAAAHA